ncbi:E3 ubiquitin-protein ligase rnf8 isoform X1 [Toxotes jaculatrix]|uniref:E3 ubiquitin-protein ligase rnf8 isoform X1 n=1 Tax=Toxotes jaculatrix TaxID=941984 RepID=UPI001B3AB28A|nr:E3 ubiquitin-protein ligase rnf8 isoform X1 [Toxotes jaculatrix]XP_040920491.1 E3 ubiquitin-protein ligase rnf8 isoform X1 [Toxotes jaculatrix]XP_040920493.1 E3 ubiquitin-protein ligase rnf8 isoform X1 [Toxotes jaculatrix]
MDNVATDCPAAEEDECSDSEVLCLMRVGRNSEWLRLFENTEITIGRGVDVTYQLLSASCPLMISRLHCTFKQREDGQWTVTDKKSLNGVRVNGNRIPAEEAHQLRLGDSIQLGVPVIGTKVEFEYILVQRPLKDIKRYLAKGHKESAKAAHVSKKPKRKLSVEEVEPSTSKPKLYRSSNADKSFAKPCPLSQVKHQQRLSHTQAEETGPSRLVQEVDRPSDGSSNPCDLDNLQMYSQNILLLRERVDDTQRQVASLEGEPQQADPLREEQVRELQGQLETLRAKMHQMETLEKSFSETKRQLEAQKTQQQEELLKKQLEEALQEQKKVIDELAVSRQGFEEVLLAKNKELEVTKEEKEKARAQKEEVVTQVTEVLENELQCIICSELFIEAVILNCAHSFCCYCIKQWRKKRDVCPICQQAIQSQTRCLALDNCIDRMVENLSLDMKAWRQTLITERKDKQACDHDAIRSANSAAAEVMVIHDDDSSWSSESDSSMESIDSSLSSVVSVDTDSSIHLDSSSPYSGYSDESVDEFED